MAKRPSDGRTDSREALQREELLRWKNMTPQQRMNEFGKLLEMWHQGHPLRRDLVEMIEDPFGEAKVIYESPALKAIRIRTSPA